MDLFHLLDFRSIVQSHQVNHQVVKTKSNRLSAPSSQRRTCMCSPTTHPGSFRCSLHRNYNNNVVTYSSNRVLHFSKGILALYKRKAREALLRQDKQPHSVEREIEIKIMGGKQSKSKSGRYSQSASSSINHGRQPTSKKPLEKYTRIDDNYNTLDEVTKALSQAGLESSNLIVGIDFTQSNESTGAKSFEGKSLHHIAKDVQNPYEQAIYIIGKTLSPFDEDDLIPCYGFGDATTGDQDVFSFYPGDRPCNGFEESLARYRELVPHLCLYGPTSFAPIIETAIGIVDNSGGQYHVLLIIADGQVTSNKQEQATVNAIVKASAYPLSIVVVGVGDGPWEMMKQFDDNIPVRAFDNFQFVNFTEIMARNIPTSKKETEFALAALMEIPSQYKATLELGLLGNKRGTGTGRRAPRPPPIKN